MCCVTFAADIFWGAQIFFARVVIKIPTCKAVTKYLLEEDAKPPPTEV